MNRSLNIRLLPYLQGVVVRRGTLFGWILLVALLAFELFNFSTTDFALRDVLGDLTFAGLRWATILSLAFCGIDFAGIARLFTPEKGENEPAEVWYLFGAWLLAAGMNAILTWWGVSIAVLNHTSAGGALLGQGSMTGTVPVFVALMVWVIRVLIIGTFSIAGEKLFSQAAQRPARSASMRPASASSRAAPPAYVRPTPRPLSASGSRRPPVPEPTYHPVGMSARSANVDRGIRQ